MKYTAIDLAHRKINKGFRGYKVHEVDDLLREIASELEQAALDRANIEEQFELIRQEVNRYREMEDTLNNAILLAQKTADQLKATAHQDAELIQREAEQRAKDKESQAILSRQSLVHEIRELERKRDELLWWLKSTGEELTQWAGRWTKTATVSFESVQAQMDDPASAEADVHVLEATEPEDVAATSQA